MLPATISASVPETEASHSGAMVHRSARVCCGVPLGFEAHTSKWLASLVNVIPGLPFQTPQAVQANFSIGPDQLKAGKPASYQVRVNGTSIRREMSAPGALSFMEHHVPEAVALLSPNLVLVHAAVVGWQGRAIVLPGSSWAGKTTLTMALVEAGATYYSDEYAVLDDHANVHPYLRAPHTRSGASRDTACRLEHAISSGDLTPPPLPVGLVLLSTYSEDAVWSPRRLTCSQALFALLAHTIAVRYRPELSLRVLREVSSAARAFQTQRGEARATAKAIFPLLDLRVE